MYSSLDVYNAMCDAENGFDSGALDRLTGVHDYDNDDEGGLDYDDVYSPEELEIIRQFQEDQNA